MQIRGTLPFIKQLKYMKDSKGVPFKDGDILLSSGGRAPIKYKCYRAGDKYFVRLLDASIGECHYALEYFIQSHPDFRVLITV